MTSTRCDTLSGGLGISTANAVTLALTPLPVITKVIFVADSAGEIRRFDPKSESPGAEGATAPETLRQKDRAFVDSDTLESASPSRVMPPKV